MSINIYGYIYWDHGLSIYTDIYTGITSLE
jgi:hypothetical protein